VAEQDLIKLARENVEAFSAGDWRRFSAPLAPDAVYNELATGRRIQGPDQIVQVTRAWKEAFPDAKGRVTNAIASGNTVAQEITWEGTQNGPLQGPSGTIPASGRRAVVPAVQVLTFEGDKIKENRHYFDMMGMLQQLGVAPE
jgi:steroid delta-isomerase-like uncharacterized protein